MQVKSIKWLNAHYKKLLLDSGIEFISRETLSNLKELLLKDRFRIRTGYSGFDQGYGRKLIWSYELSCILNTLKISHASGNDAPRGGANGEYIIIIKNPEKFQINIIKN